MINIMFNRKPQNYLIQNRPLETRFKGFCDLLPWRLRGKTAKVREKVGGCDDKLQDVPYCPIDAKLDNFVFYDDPYDLYFDLSRGIYHALADKPNLDRAINFLTEFKQKLAHQRNLPVSEEELSEIHFLIELVYELYRLKHQMATKTDRIKKDQLKKHYKEKAALLHKNSPSHVDELLEIDWQAQQIKKQEEEARRLFPNDFEDSEARANYLERF
ncbi:MAG: hypothetical protein K0R52_438 [Alphaproteobacteria bacterium]|jgi:hypothetical protein|nr:hypothetical protein [Alphaproteobacteria bacterium]